MNVHGIEQVSLITFVSNLDTSCFNSAKRALCSVNLILTFMSSSFMRDSKSEYLQAQSLILIWLIAGDDANRLPMLLLSGLV
jgi:hypothetical protein